jgi:hypothetical protein
MAGSAGRVVRVAPGIAPYRTSIAARGASIATVVPALPSIRCSSSSSEPIAAVPPAAANAQAASTYGRIEPAANDSARRRSG